MVDTAMVDKAITDDAATDMADEGPIIDGLPFNSLKPSPTRNPNPDNVAPPLKRDRGSAWKLVCGGLLSGLSLPVAYQEPLSFLQRLAEDLEYSFLLDRAAAASSSIDRIGLIAAFVVSHVSSTRDRALQPFNPLLGETFELVDPDRRLALVAEQTSHHPAVSALHAQGPGWILRQTQRVKLAMHASSVEAWPAGEIVIQLTGTDERFVYEKPRCHVAGIARGPVWLDNAGTVIVLETKRRELMAVLDFERAPSRRSLGKVTGRVSRPLEPEVSLSKIAGDWTNHLLIDGETVWEVAKRPGVGKCGGHDASEWGWTLNATAEARHGLPCTDSRFRPDQRLLEKGCVKESQSRKKDLEDKQRKRQARREKDGEEGTGEPYRPKWFVKDGNAWVYDGEYFVAKREGWQVDLPAIFEG